MRFQRSVVWLWRTLLTTFTLLFKGRDFPANMLRNELQSGRLQLKHLRVRGFDDSTAENAYRDTCRILGCFEFDDVAGTDLSDLMVSNKTIHLCLSSWCAGTTVAVGVCHPGACVLACLFFSISRLGHQLGHNLFSHLFELFFSKKNKQKNTAQTTF